MQSVSSRIWTRVTVFISFDDNNYTTGTSQKRGGHLIYIWFLPQVDNFDMNYERLFFLLAVIFAALMPRIFSPCGAPQTALYEGGNMRVKKKLKTVIIYFYVMVFQKRNLIFCCFFNSNFFHVYSFLFGRSQTNDMLPCRQTQLLINSGDWGVGSLIWRCCEWLLAETTRSHRDIPRDIPSILYIFYNQYLSIYLCDTMGGIHFCAS